MLVFFDIEATRKEILINELVKAKNKNTNIKTFASSKNSN